MTLHDVDIRRFGQWWRRATRAGHAFAELADRHPDVTSPPWRRRCRSIVAWGLGWPALLASSLVAAAAWDARALVPAALLVLGWGAQAARIAARQRRRLPARLAIASGILTMIGKVAEATGLLRYQRGRLGGGKAGLIEYKGAAA